MGRCSSNFGGRIRWKAAFVRICEKSSKLTLTILSYPHQLVLFHIDQIVDIREKDNTVANEALVEVYKNAENFVLPQLTELQRRKLKAKVDMDVNSILYGSEANDSDKKQSKSSECH